MKKNRKVLFIGSKQLGLECLKMMHSSSQKSLIGVITLDDSSDTRTKFQEFRKFCREKNLKLYVTYTKKEADEVIGKLTPDICFVIGWYRIFSKATLKLVPNGFIGIHNSLLPKYRGGSPLVWSIINGEKKTGFSVFSFSDGMDEGNIWVQKEIEIKKTDYVSDVLIKIEKEAASQMKKNYLKIVNGKIKPKPQNHKLATFCAQRIPEDGLINWYQPAEKIYNFIRAQSVPYPGAFTFFGGNKLTVWKAEIIKEVYYGTPGQVARVTDNGVKIICGENTVLLITDVSYAERNINPREIIKSINTRL
jgi:methionyl-tRNA formyltransferase